MQKYKIAVSRNQKRYDLVLQANSELEARERIHKEGYSILNVEEIGDINIAGSKFYFVIKISDQTKTGVIYGSDIFKVYLKLKKDFGYDVVSLFSDVDKDKDDEYKNNILKKVIEEYNLYIENTDKTLGKLDDKKEFNITEEDFYLKKQLEETYKLIDFVLLKINNILTNKYFVVEEEQKEKLKFIYNNLISIKNGKNISKLKEISELALVKIGKLELQYIEQTKTEQSRELLKDTNKLLKQIGSKEQFIEKEKDLNYQFNQFFSKLKLKYQNLKENTQSLKKESLDKETHSYIKTLVLLKKYKEKQKLNNNEILKNILIFIFPSKLNNEKKDYLLSRKLVISQNISLLNAKLEGKLYSYTKIVKGYKFIEGNFLAIKNYLNNYILLCLVIFSLFFIGGLFLNYTGLFNVIIGIDGIKSALLLFIIFLFLLLSRGFFTFIFNFVFFYILYIFLIVNF